MNHPWTRSAWGWWCGVGTLLCAVRLFAADPPALRVAIGPFFAPVSQPELNQVSDKIPELLTVELSQGSRFQLVEREKVQAIWTELHMTALGLASRESVAQLGQVLSCDWIVSGSFVQTDEQTLIWAKVIAVRNGVVHDMNALPYVSTNLSATVARLAAFVSKAGADCKGRQFLSLGRFADQRPWLSAVREDWSRRLVAAIEQEYAGVGGYGVVELEAVAPIVEERRLESAALMVKGQERVRLQPAFWLLDGGCKWIEGKPDTIEIGLRVQRVGGPEQMFHVNGQPGAALVRNVLQTLAQGLSDTNQAPPEKAAQAEAELLAKRAMELATLRAPFPVEQRSTPSNPLESCKRQVQDMAWRKDNARLALTTYERTLLLEPDNFEAKKMLGSALLIGGTPSERERGRRLLQEIIDGQDPRRAEEARRFLARSEQAGQIVERDRFMSRLRLGQALLQYGNEEERERGRKMLVALASGSNPSVAEEAKTSLAAAEARKPE